jgi:hypothetical protein
VHAPLPRPQAARPIWQSILRASACKLIEPWPAWDGGDFLDMPILIETRGNTTTDHNSPADVWLRYRGDLARLSRNLLNRSIVPPSTCWRASMGKLHHAMTATGAVALTVAAAIPERSFIGSRRSLKTLRTPADGSLGPGPGSLTVSHDAGARSAVASGPAGR